MSRRPLVLGLTGSIGMGKSTTAGFFREAGIPVWDADAAVHRLYGPDGAAVGPVGEICPQAVGPQGLDRARLREWIARDDSALGRIESIVHPLVARDRADFIDRAGREGHDIVVVDVPLLFETGGDRAVDATLVVTAPPDVQRARVLERPGMDQAHLDRILAKQMPDSEKRARADYVIETRTPEWARAEVARVIADLRKRIAENA